MRWPLLWSLSPTVYWLVGGTQGKIPLSPMHHWWVLKQPVTDHNYVSAPTKVEKNMYLSILFHSGVHTCFVCKQTGNGLKRCIIPLCGKFYHADCILAFSATQPHNKGFRCPLHVCLSCHIANPLNICSSKGKLHFCSVELHNVMSVRK